MYPELEATTKVKVNSNSSLRGEVLGQAVQRLTDKDWRRIQRVRQDLREHAIVLTADTIARVMVAIDRRPP